MKLFLLFLDRNKNVLTSIEMFKMHAKNILNNFMIIIVFSATKNNHQGWGLTVQEILASRTDFSVLKNSNSVSKIFLRQNLSVALIVPTSPLQKLFWDEIGVLSQKVLFRDGKASVLKSNHLSNTLEQTVDN